MPRRGARLAWALLALFIVYGSAGTWAGARPGVVAPLHLSWPDVAQNVLLFLPFGALGVLALGVRPRTRTRVVARVTGLAALFIVGLETAQLYSLDRTASVTDLVAGSVGALLGALLAPRVARALDAVARHARRLGLVAAPELPALLVLVAAMMLVAWWPFDVTLDPSTLAARVRVFTRDPWRSGVLVEVASQALQYALLAMLLAVCLLRMRPGQAAVVACVTGWGVAGLLDVGQFAMGAPPVGVTVAGGQIAGALSGGVVFRLARGA